MYKIVLLLIISVVLISCYDDNQVDAIESTDYMMPIFVGNDSIIFVEFHTKQEPTEVGILESWVKIKMIDKQGNDISTIWGKNLYEVNAMHYWQPYCIDYNNWSKEIMLGYYGGVMGESIYFGVIILGLDGSIVEEFEDKEMEKMSYQDYDRRYTIHVSPNGKYYAISNKIKNMRGELVTTIADTVMDWNAKGLLVKKSSIDSASINIEGSEYFTYAHPDAHFWFGQDQQYIRYEHDTAFVCNWWDSYIIKKVGFVISESEYPYGYGGYSPYGYGGYGGYGYPQYGQSIMTSASISPDLKYMVLGFRGIHLLDLNTGKPKPIRFENMQPYDYGNN